MQLHSHAPAPALRAEDPLQPFEQDLLRRLINQLEATPPRVRVAFEVHLKAAAPKWQ